MYTQVLLKLMFVKKQNKKLTIAPHLMTDISKINVILKYTKNKVNIWRWFDEDGSVWFLCLMAYQPL